MKKTWCALRLVLGGPLLAGALLAGPAAADDLTQILSGQSAKPFIEPEGYYAIVIPAGFDCEVRARHVRCNGNRGHAALLTIDVKDVPASATADLVLLNQMDRFKKQPHFKVISQGKTAIDGTPAVTAAFSYDYLANVEYQVGVQALYLVRGGKLYVMHFEARLEYFRDYGKDLAQLYGSFMPARIDAGGHPILEDLNPSGGAAARTPEDFPDIKQQIKPKGAPSSGW